MTPLSRRDPAGIFLSSSFLHLPLGSYTGTSEPRGAYGYSFFPCDLHRFEGWNCRCLAMFSFKRSSKIWPEEKQILIQLFWREKSSNASFFLSFTRHQKITKHRKSYFEFYKQWCKHRHTQSRWIPEEKYNHTTFSRFQPPQLMYSGMLLKAWDCFLPDFSLKPHIPAFLQKKKKKKAKTKKWWGQKKFGING